MSTNEAALALHPVRAALLAYHGHGKSAMAKSLHKTAQSFSAIVHGPHQQLALTLAIVALVVVACYGVWITFIRPSRSS